MRQGSWVNCLGLVKSEEKIDFCPKFVPRAGRASRLDSGSLCKSIRLAAGCADDLRVAKPLEFSRKKGLLLVSNPFCLYLLQWLRGLDLNQRPSGYEDGASHLGSLILRDLAPRPAARLLSQICPRHSCAFVTLSGPEAGPAGVVEHS